MANFEEIGNPDASPYALGITVTINSKDLLDENSGVNEKYSNNIDELITRRFNQFEQELKKALEQVDTLPSLFAFTNYPSLATLIEGDEYQVVFDSELLETLVTLYINGGWYPIWSIEQQLGSKCSDEAKQRLMPSSGGVYVEDAAQWIPVQSYFVFIRNILAILIRNALASIEKKAADLMLARLNYARDEVANVWQKFSYKWEEVEDDYSDEQGRVSRSTYIRFNADKDKIRNLYNELHDIYLQGQKLEEITDQLQRTKENISSVKSHIRGSRAQNQRERLKRFNTRLDNLQLQKASIEKLISGSTEFLQLSTESVVRENPASLLVMGALSNIYSPEALEQILGNILWQFLKDVENDAIKSSKSLSCRLLPIQEDLKDPSKIKNYAKALGPDGVDGLVIDSAIEMLNGNLLIFGILNEEILDGLIEQESISKESFEYIVCIRYSSILPRKLKEAEENKDKFLKSVSTASAALSIATLVTPETAPISGLLRGVSFVVNMYVLAHHYQNLAKKYASLNQRMTELLVSDKAIGQEVLARVGELAILRKEICNEMTLEAILPLVMVSLDKFQSLKVLLRDYALIMDIQTLAEASST